jgi:hypothetical protein
MVLPARTDYPCLTIGRAHARTDHAAMEVIAPARITQRPSLVPILGMTVVGTLLVVGGITLAYVALATPLLGELIPPGRPSIGEMATGVVIWALALVAPAACILAGTNRLARMLATLRGRVAPRSRTAAALDSLGADVVVATGLTLPDGRGCGDLVVGPFGAAVVRELPPPAVTRIQNGQWQLRANKGWVPMEDPLDRGVRDAERVRRWFAHDDADFVVKVYAAVVSSDPPVERTVACAVLRPDQLAAWVGALPPQRSLTEGRRDRMLEVVRGAAI